MRRLLPPLAVTAPLTLLLLLGTPEALLAWGPATHIHLGLEVLRSLGGLAGPTVSLLSTHPVAFLYGTVAADLPLLGKRYVSGGRHPHSWGVGREVLDAAGEDPALRAASLGYLCHLAADVVAHEAFLPRMLLLTSSTRALGHSYWELRMDVAVGADRARLAGATVLERDHRRFEALLERVLDRTLVTFRTNRKLFYGMVRISDDDRWQSVFDSMVEVSRWDLSPREAGLWMDRAFDLTMGLLRDGHGSRAAAGDPTGEGCLSRSKLIRRQVLRRDPLGRKPVLRRAADRYYPLPPSVPPSRWDRGSTEGTVVRVRDLLLRPGRSLRAG